MTKVFLQTSDREHEGRRSIVTEGMHGVQLLTSQKPINSPRWWKGKFALFHMLPGGAGRRVDICPKTGFPPVAATGERAFIDRRRGHMQKQDSQFRQSSSN